MAVDTAKIRELRERTGLPMMECKKALETAGGDLESAVENLRKAGAKAQEKLAGRKATQGRVGSQVSEDGRLGVLVTLCCETEPVANNDQFIAFLDDLVKTVVEQNPTDEAALASAKLPSGSTVEEGLTQLVNQLRENIQLGPFCRLEGDAIVQYVHFDNRKAGMVALAGVSVSDDAVVELGRDLCMHVVFTKPKSLDEGGLDPDLLAKEREIRIAAAKNDPKNAKKPAQIIEKIVDGQMKKYVQEVALLEQAFVKDDKSSVRGHVEASGTGASVTGFFYAATDV